MRFSYCKWGLLLSVLLLLPPNVLSKRTRGKFKLSGANTEHVMSSFAVNVMGGRATIRIGSDEMYENEQRLKLHIYTESVWKAFRKATLCSEKIELALKSYDLSFNFKGDGPMVPRGGKWQAVKTVMLGDPNTDEKLPHPTFFYFVVDDCSLERYLHDNKIPMLNYEVNTWNYIHDAHSKHKRTSQLGAEEDGLFDTHGVTAVFSAITVGWLFLNMTARLARKKNNNTVHAAVLWIGLAAALDCASSICILFHMEVYHYNGVGIYFLDALAAHLEAVCDAALILFLLSLAAGWTLPSDVVGVNATANSMSSVLADMAKPLGGLSKMNSVGVFGITVVALHVILAQWGRTYNDDFESYHDFAHLPGRILMGLRFVLGFAFLGTTLQTRLHCKVHQLQTFYAILAAMGFVWFQMLPILTVVCNWCLPLLWQRSTVFIASAVLQSTSLALLAWLVTSHATVYHQYSHMSTNDKAPSLTESLSHPSDVGGTREWKLLGKAKVRLD